MTDPAGVFLAVTLGLLAGGGVQAVTAPVGWAVSGLEAPRVARAQACAADALRVRAGLTDQ